MKKIITVRSKKCPLCEKAKKTGEVAHRVPLDCLTPGKYEVVEHEFYTEYKPMEEKLKINDNERKVLNILVPICDNEQNCTFFKYIAKDSGLDIKQVKRACRSLAKKGLTEYVRGLFDDDGMVAGSGYCATSKARDLLT